MGRTLNGNVGGGGKKGKMRPAFFTGEASHQEKNLDLERTTVGRKGGFVGVWGEKPGITGKKETKKPQAFDRPPNRMAEKGGERRRVRFML